MNLTLPAEITEQVALACTIIHHHFADTLMAIHLFGSAVDGGLKKLSDIDLLVVVSVRPNETTRRSLMQGLLTCSTPLGNNALWRPLEVTVIVHEDVFPWRYPPMRVLQFGEWLRQDLLSGIFEPPVRDHDLAILLTKARQHSATLAGIPAQELFEPVPLHDFSGALLDTMAQWNTQDNWKGDERNVLLALARIWYSASTGRITSKDIAAEWALTQLPPEHRPVLSAALAQYLGNQHSDPVIDNEKIAALVHFVRPVVEAMLAKQRNVID